MNNRSSAGPCAALLKGNEMKKLQRGATLTALLIWLVIAVAAVGGWIANIVKLIGMNLDVISGMLIARAIGVFVAPLGAVLGYL